MPMRVDPVLTGVLVPLKTHGALPAGWLGDLQLLGLGLRYQVFEWTPNNRSHDQISKGFGCWDVSHLGNLAFGPSDKMLVDIRISAWGGPSVNQMYTHARMRLQCTCSSYADDMGPGKQAWLHISVHACM